MQKIFGFLLAAIGLNSVLTKRAEADIVPDSQYREPITELDLSGIANEIKEGFIPMKNAPRGIRNNNPGNLVITSIPWKGKVPVFENTDGRFEQFYNAEDGIRALMLDLLNDYQRDNANTIRKLINQFAPNHENNTAAYIQAVSNDTGFGADEIINLQNRNTMLSLVKAIIKHENGVNYSNFYSASTLEAALKRIA